MRIATKEDTPEAVIFRFADDDDPGVSVLTIYKTDPVKYTFEPSAVRAVQVCKTWQDMVEAHTSSVGFAWTEI